MRLKSSKLREEIRRTRQMREEAEKRWGEVGGGLPKFKNTNNQPRPPRLLYQQSRTQHSTRRNMSSQGKTRDKTRQAKTR